MLERTLLDRFIGHFSPEAGLKRLQNRAATKALLLHYEAGSGTSGRDRWRANSSGPDAAARATLTTIRNRSRDLVRNNPWARSAVDCIETETVGTGIIPKITAKTKRGTEALEELWKAWAETPVCDADGVLDFYGLQALALRTIAESGDVLVRRRTRRPSDGLPVPLQIQLLEPDHLDTSKDTVRGDGSKVVGGIDIDALGRRSGYWLFPEHPGEVYATFSQALVSRFVPADGVLHNYRVERPGQIRGIPWGASALIRLRDFDEYEDAQLVRQKIAACFAVFLTDTNGSVPAAMLGVGDPTDPAAGPKPPPERVYPGMLQTLGAGQDVKFAAPPGSEGQEAYSRTVLRAIAAGFGTTYEALTGDLSNVNFSSARLGHIRHYRSVQAWRWRILIPRFCVPVWNWFLTMAELQGYDVREATATWSPPARDMIDPKTEVLATRTEIRAGLKSLSAAIRERGEDPSEVLEELASDRDRLDELGLFIESDARRPSNGQPGDPSAQVSKEQAAADQAQADAAAAADDQADS